MVVAMMIFSIMAYNYKYVYHSHNNEEQNEEQQNEEEPALELKDRIYEETEKGK